MCFLLIHNGFLARKQTIYNKRKISSLQNMHQMLSYEISEISINIKPFKNLMFFYQLAQYFYQILWFTMPDISIKFYSSRNLIIFYQKHHDEIPSNLNSTKLVSNSIFHILGHFDRRLPIEKSHILPSPLPRLDSIRSYPRMACIKCYLTKYCILRSDPISRETFYFPINCFSWKCYQTLLA